MIGTMTNVISRRALALALLAAGWLGMLSAAHAATVRAYVQPETARPNQTVTYVIAVQDGSVERFAELRLPLPVQQTTGVSTSQQFGIINGRQTSSVRLSWGLMASEPGEFVIPAQNIKVNGQTVATNEVKLQIVPGGDDAAALPDSGSQPILQLELGKKEIYQGEVMPLNCTLYIPRQTALRRLGLIDIEKSDFAISRFPQQSDQTTTVIDGVGYIVLTYRSTLSSLRTGDLKVGPASMEITVDVPVENAPSQNMFAPGFPPDFFGVPTEPRKLVVKSQPLTLKVLPLPEEGKPDKFSGAVGDFILTASATPTELTVGDPLAVELIIEGIGNFDALTAPELTAPGGWKAYPAKRYSIEGQLDQSQVPTLDRKIGYSQVFIPEAVHNTLPPFELHYFSVSKKKYVTLRTEALPLNMKPAPAVATSEVAPGAAVGEAIPPPLVADPQPDITDIIINPPSTSRWISPTGTLLLRSTTFWSVQAVPVGLLLIASLLSIMQRRRQSRMAGRAGELRTAWAPLEEKNLPDAEFLRRAAQFIHTAKEGETLQEPELKSILDRYQTTNFTAAPPAPVTPQERQQITQTLSRLFSRTLSKVTPLILLALLISGSIMAQTAPSAGTTPDSIYQEALAEMEKGNFARAQYHAESLTKKDPPQLSPEVFQLIGHARYRQEDLGRAVLWYQRAQLFDARSPELRQNLRHLYEKLRFVSFQPGSPLKEWSLWLTLNEWMILASIGVWLFLLSISWRIFIGSKSLPWAVAMSMLGLLIALPATAFATLRPLGAERVRDISIVTVPDVSAFTAATVTSGTVMDLPAGSQVRVLEKRGAWDYVEIPDKPENLRGWVEAAAITPLWIWDEHLIP